MGCNCSKGGRLRNAIAVNNTPSAGAYQLATYPNCLTLHTGEHQGKSLYVAARGTTDERLFAKTQLVEAAAYANGLRASLENLPTAALCDDAVIAVYG